MDRFPNPHEESEDYKDPELDLDDDEESEDNPEGTRNKRKRNFLETWLKRSEKSDSNPLLEPAEKLPEDKNQSAWQKIGSFLGSLGSDKEPKENTPIVEAANGDTYEELEQTLESPTGESEPAAVDEPLVVFERSPTGDLRTPSAERAAIDEPDSEPAVEAEETPVVVDSSPETTIVADIETEPADPTPETPTFEEESPVPRSETRDYGHAEAYEAGQRPVEIHEHNEYIEKRGGGLSLADVLIYRNASNKIRAQGKRIEELRRETKQQEAASQTLHNKSEKLETKVSDILTSSAKKPEVAPVIVKSETSQNTVDRLLSKFEASGKEAAAVRVEAKKPEVQKPAFERSEAKEVFEQRLIEQERVERERQRSMQTVEGAPNPEEKEDPHELRYEQSHEAKQFTATALADAISESQVKQLIESAQSRPAYPAPNNSRQPSSSQAPAGVPEQPTRTNQQAMIAGITAAVVLMVIIFIMVALT